MSKKPTKSVKKKKELRRKTPPKSEVTLPIFWKDSKNLIPAIAALLITLACFFNTTNNEFVNWDDDRNFYENEHVITTSADNFWSNTKEIFSSTVIGNYNPLTIWTFAIENRIYGIDNPGPWHGTNVFLHLLCVFFVYRISLLLGLRWQGALIVALLFGIHPMRVESVAWLTERKDVLFGVFYLAALFLYIKGKTVGKVRHIVIAILFLLSLFSKIQAVVLPLSMLAVDYYLSGKITKKDIFQKGPYFILSLLFGLLGVFILDDQGSLESAATYPAWQRIFVGSYSYLIYLVKAIVPYKMSPLYPYASSLPLYYYPTIFLGPSVLYGLYYTYKNDLRIWFFGLAFFTVNIMFLLQILGAGQGFLADRFTYIAYFGLFFIAGYFFDKYINETPKYKSPLMGAAVLIFIAFGFLTIKQNQVWKNSETLWSHVLKYYQNSTLPYGNRANYLRSQGRIQEALSDYSKSIALKPDGQQAYNSRARLYFDIAKSADTLRLALNDYNKAISLDPQNGEFYVNRGATFARLGDADNAIKDMTLGIQFKPDHAVGYLNRSVMYNQQGNVQAALEDINSYLNLKPYNADIWYEKARSLRGLNRINEAIPAYSRAIKINNGKAIYHYERGRTYSFLGKLAEAKVDILNAMNLGYKNVDPALKNKLGI
ncbi:MAG: tetratricopeptide (TPR) repeat protein [Saprospiraceae bacterium]|jgi:tetratricopeptide (TPR) repeat protein